MFTTFSVDGIEEAYVIDITSMVQSWLSTPASNFGLWLEGTTIVGSGENRTSSPFWAAAFKSGFNPSPPIGPGGVNNVNAPLLTITQVPEPASVLLAAAGIPLLAWWRDTPRASDSVVRWTEHKTLPRRRWPAAACGWAAGGDLDTPWTQRVRNAPTARL